MMTIQQAIAALMERRNLFEEEMVSVMRQIMTGEATPAQIGGFLIALRMKGETVEEVASAATVMRELSTKVPVKAEHLVDTCGTGGDASGSFNISTASALVAAAAGAKVAKHGNRSVSSGSGSADVLEAAGVNLSLSTDQISECIDALNVGFLFAPAHHSAMKHAIGPRKEMGVRTIFNVLGPLTNPAAAPNQVIGVFSKEWVEPLAEVLLRLGSEHVMVVHALDGMDEISISGDTFVAELKNGEISTYILTPEQFGLRRSGLMTLNVDGPDHSLATIHNVLDGKPGGPRDIVALNAGAAIYVSGVVESLQEGVEKALQVIDSGQAKETLAKLVTKTNEMKSADE